MFNMNEYLFLQKNKSNQVRLDSFVSESLGVSRSKAQKLILDKLVSVNGELKKKNHILKNGDKIIVNHRGDEEYVAGNASATCDYELDIIEETPDYIAVNKPSGLVVHPDCSHPTGSTLIDLVVSRFPEISKVGDDPTRPGVVHRLDKLVSGVMIIARTQNMFDHLKNQFKNHTIQKKYIALVHGAVIPEFDSIDYTISRKKTGFMSAHTDKSIGKDAITEIEVAQRFPNSTLLHVFPRTGRTHQIRVHLFAYGHPIIGDNIYSNSKTKRLSIDKKINRPFLHAHSIGFKDTRDTQRFHVADMDLVLQSFLDELNKKYGK